MKTLIDTLRGALNEETNIKDIVVTWKEGTGDNIKAIEFNLIYNDGKVTKYRSEASPFIHNTFLWYVKKGWYGKAINLVKPFTKRVEG